MFTVCPKCALTLVVTAADLRVAQGYVRCGRCSSVFNALAQLSDERGAARGPGAPPAESRAEEPEEPQEPPADALDFNPETTDASSVFVAPSPSPEWTAATGSFKSLVAANQEPVTPGSPAGEKDQGVDVQLGADLLSDIVHGEPPQSAPPLPQTSFAAEPRPAGLAPGTPAVPAMPASTGLALERETLPGADGGFGAWAPREPVPAPQAT
ncbi:MAG TPA: MJ0042-type zinc finger domain-containing protein, partial [Steroidobacteraceae bacterium]|nr:MJ0042-type zinc finger domain-containing protein [Steroidobacteraceae bacterium]